MRRLDREGQSPNRRDACSPWYVRISAMCAEEYLHDIPSHISRQHLQRAAVQRPRPRLRLSGGRKNGNHPRCHGGRPAPRRDHRRRSFWKGGQGHRYRFHQTPSSKTLQRVPRQHCGAPEADDGFHAARQEPQREAGGYCGDPAGRRRHGRGDPPIPHHAIPAQ